MRFFQNSVARHDVRMVQLQEERDLVLVLDEGVEILLDRHLDRAPPSRAQHLAEQHGHHEREREREREGGKGEGVPFLWLQRRPSQREDLSVWYEKRSERVKRDARTHTRTRTHAHTHTRTRAHARARTHTPSD